MSTKFAVGLTIAIMLCVMGALSYILWQYLTPVPRVDKRLPVRKGKNTVIVFPERHASSGLAWSKKHYAADYSADNTSVSEFVGIEGDRGAERFLDIGARAYSRAFLDTFSYTEEGKRPQIQVEYLKSAEAFTGRIVGKGLKPNFAYQVKLRGIYSADKKAFERIGKVGRWRLPGVGVNYLDKDYDEFKEKDKVESYLLFDFFVSDGYGQVDKLFYLDSTLHVLWSQTNQRRPSMTDTRPIAFVRTETNPDFYAHPHVDLAPQNLFAESEQHSIAPKNRPAIGEAFLSPGKYKAEVVLTEESFHGYGDNGFWATVMAAPVEFEIIDRPRPTPYWKKLDEGAALSLKKAQTANVKDERAEENLMTGIATSESPTLFFAEKLNLSDEGRKVLTAELFASGRHQWQIVLDTEEEPSEYATYIINTIGRTGWQKFEVEITTNRDAQRLRIVPVGKKGYFGIRNVRICPVVD